MELFLRNLINSKIDVKVDFDSPKTLGLHGIKKSFKSYDSLVKFCSSLDIKSAIPAEADLIDNADSVYYLQ